MLHLVNSPSFSGKSRHSFMQPKESCRKIIVGLSGNLSIRFKAISLNFILTFVCNFVSFLIGANAYLFFHFWKDLNNKALLLAPYLV